MNESMPQPQTPQEQPESPQKSMTEEETHAFLQEKDIKPLTNWKPGEPLLYVMEEVTRQTEGGPFSDLPEHARPNFAVIRNPAAITFDRLFHFGDRAVHGLLNEFGGTVDYYTIDPETKEISFMLLPSSDPTRRKMYQVKKENLYEPNDTLFPPSK